MERERFFVPKNSILYCLALLLSLTAVVMKFISNYNHFGAIVPEFAAEPLMPMEVLGPTEETLPFLGIVRIAAELSFPFGLVLAKKAPSRIHLGFVGIILFIFSGMVCALVECMSTYHPLNILLAIIVIAVFCVVMLVPVILLAIFMLVFKLTDKGKIQNTMVMCVVCSIMWLLTPLTYYAMYSESMYRIPLTDWLFSAVGAVAVFVFCLSLQKAPESVVFGIFPDLDNSRRGALYIPDRSPLYAAAVAISVFSVIFKLIYNTLAHGVPEYEFVYDIGGSYTVGSVLGILHIITDLTIPLGFILCKKKLWKASFGILFSSVQIIVGLIAVTFSVAESIILSITVGIFVLITDITIYLVLVACSCFIAYRTNIHKSIIKYYPSLCWFILALAYHFFYSMYLEYKPEPTIFGAVAYLMPAAAAFVLGCSIKNMPIQESTEVSVEEEKNVLTEPPSLSDNVSSDS